jgi:hypothetical protein
MKGTFTFMFLLNGNEETLTVVYSNPFVNMLQLNQQTRAQTFNLCALSYITGRLDEQKISYSNLRLISMQYI